MQYTDGRLCTNTEKEQPYLHRTIKCPRRTTHKTNTHISQDYLNFTLFEKE